jgi:HD-like signal output (HDOD) protein
LVLASLFPEAYARAMARARAGEVKLLQAEQQECGTSHAEAGAYLLGLWGLPESLVSLVAHVHQPGRIRASSISVTALAAVHVASRLEVAASDVPLAATEPLDEGYLQSLRVDSARLTSWKEATREFA